MFSLLLLASFTLQWLYVEKTFGASHGSLRQENPTDGNKNYHKLEIFFDTDCVSSQEQAEV